MQAVYKPLRDAKKSAPAGAGPTGAGETLRKGENTPYDARRRQTATVASAAAAISSEPGSGTAVEKM